LACPATIRVALLTRGELAARGRVNHSRSSPCSQGCQPKNTKVYPKHQIKHDAGMPANSNQYNHLVNKRTVGAERRAWPARSPNKYASQGSHIPLIRHRMQARADSILTTVKAKEDCAACASMTNRQNRLCSNEYLFWGGGGVPLHPVLILSYAGHSNMPCSVLQFLNVVASTSPQQNLLPHG